MSVLRFPFCAGLVRLNHPLLDDFSHFFLQPAMLFGAPRKWWGDGGFRQHPHEGVDLRFYLDRTGRQNQLKAGMMLPALAPGRVARIVEDFLGHSIFVIHELKGGAESNFLSAYGHVDPLLRPDSNVTAGEILAAIARPRIPAVPAHLHLSTAWLPAEFPPERLAWHTLLSTPGVIFFDPLPLLDCPHRSGPQLIGS